MIGEQSFYKNHMKYATSSSREKELHRLLLSPLYLFTFNNSINLWDSYGLATPADIAEGLVTAANTAALLKALAQALQECKRQIVKGKDRCSCVLAIEFYRDNEAGTVVLTGGYGGKLVKKPYGPTWNEIEQHFAGEIMSDVVPAVHDGAAIPEEHADTVQYQLFVKEVCCKK